MGGVVLILALLMALFLVVSKAGIEGSSSIDAFYSHLLNGQVEDLTLSDGLATAQIRVGDRPKTMEVVVRDLLREDTELYRTLPKLKLDPAKTAADLGTLHAVIANRYVVAKRYAVSVKAACAAELAQLRARRGTHVKDVPSVGRLKRWLSADSADHLPEHDRVTLAKTLEHSKALHTIYAMRQELNALWGRSTESSEQLLARLQDWCRRAENSGIVPLAQFSLQLRRYA